MTSFFLFPLSRPKTGQSEILLVFANIIPLAAPSATAPLARNTHISRTGYVLKVSSKGYTLRIKQINDGRDIDWDVYRFVMVEAKVIAADGCKVVWLRRVRLGIVLGQEDALALEVGDIRVFDDFGKVLSRHKQTLTD